MDKIWPEYGQNVDKCGQNMDKYEHNMDKILTESGHSMTMTSIRRRDCTVPD